MRQFCHLKEGKQQWVVVITNVEMAYKSMVDFGKLQLLTELKNLESLFSPPTNYLVLNICKKKIVIIGQIVSEIKRLLHFYFSQIQSITIY